MSENAGCRHNVFVENWPVRNPLITHREPHAGHREHPGLFTRFADIGGNLKLHFGNRIRCLISPIYYWIHYLKRAILIITDLQTKLTILFQVSPWSYYLFDLPRSRNVDIFVKVAKVGCGHPISDVDTFSHVLRTPRLAHTHFHWLSAVNRMTNTCVSRSHCRTLVPYSNQRRAFLAR